jgi:hypothetical protein
VRDGSQFTCMLFHPPIDGGIPLESTVESQQFRSLSLHVTHRVLCARQAGQVLLSPTGSDRVRQGPTGSDRDSLSGSDRDSLSSHTGSDRDS